MKRKEYERQRRELEEKLAALNEYWRLFGEENSGGADEPTSSEVERAVISAINDLVESGHPVFSLRSVTRIIAKMNPSLASQRRRISDALRRMSQAGELIEIEKGRGRRPSQYRLLHADREDNLPF